ncbi:sensor histidine kinase [Actinomadura hibisca]|uniref:sensor histidine kinase n=1 Tax=Actinomadura hibisca TaxID=68565 RepID=UPI0009FDFC0F|nr:HAMP domain-containing sensor histidine kinase [Actinomadura hibisca]
MRTRVTCAATLVVGLLLVVGVVVFYQVVRATIYQGLRERGDAAVAEVATLVRRDALPGTRVLPADAAGFGLLQVVDDGGRVLAASPELRDRPPISSVRPTSDGARVAEITAVPGVALDAYLVAERVRGPDTWVTVYAAASTSSFEQVKGPFIGWLALAVLLALAAVALIVSLAVRRALRPVRVMRSELAGIFDGRGRVSVPGCHDEVAELAGSVNATLRRLEKVLDRQRGFVADVSHELRSPLTGLRAQLEVALEHPEDEDWPAVARAALGDADRLQRIVGDLLIMARLSAGVPQEHTPLDLGALVREETARRAPGRVPIEIETAADVVVRGSYGQLSRVLTNLLDNAVRHALGWVRVTVTAEEGQAVLCVIDDGSGIAPKDREAVFQRFHRLAEGRRRDSGGTGLGLPISREIAVAHGGSLVATDCDDGACLVLRLPLAPPLSGADKTGSADLK